MKMTTLEPGAALKPFLRTFTIVETDEEATRVLMPDTGLIAGFRFSGSATQVDRASADPLSDAAITGLRTSTRRMRTSAGGGVVLAMFREEGAAHFFGEPLHELFGDTLALEDLIPHSETDRVLSRIAEASDHAERVAVFEEFLLSRLAPRKPDPIVSAAVRAIRASHGSVRIAALARALGIAQDPLEKRFRRAIGASPKQYAEILRLRHAIDSHRSGASLTRASVDAGYFDQSHFNRDFRAATGESPTRFFRDIEYC